jgi:hypothetical protein
LAIYLSVGGDDVRVVLRSTSTSTFYSSELNVTFISPACAPRVSDNPVIHTGLGTPTDGSNGVVNLCTARRSREDTASIQLECRRSGGESNRENTLLDTSLMLSNRSLGNS